jgi:hypothetical protein
VTVPLCFGLIFRRVPKWSAAAGITWGLLAGLSGKYLLGWDIGQQVYLSFIMTFGIFSTSFWTGHIYKTNRSLLALLSLLVTITIGVLYANTMMVERTELLTALAWGVAGAFGVSLFLFARLFSLDSDEDRRMVAEFFKNQVSAFPLVGGTMIVMGGLLSLIFLTDLRPQEQMIVGLLIGFMMIFGAAMWYFGKKSEIRSAEAYKQ